MKVCTIITHNFDLKGPEELEQMGLDAINPNWKWSYLMIIMKFNKGISLLLYIYEYVIPQRSNAAIWATKKPLSMATVHGQDPFLSGFNILIDGSIV